MNFPEKRFNAITLASFASASLTGAVFDAACFDGPASYQFVWKGLGGTRDAKISIEYSNDKTEWKEITSLSVTMTSATASSDNAVIEIDKLSANYYRAKAIANSVDSGTMACTAIFKGRFP